MYTSNFAFWDVQTDVSVQSIEKDENLLEIDEVLEMLFEDDDDWDFEEEDDFDW